MSRALVSTTKRTLKPARQSYTRKIYAEAVDLLDNHKLGTISQSALAVVDSEGGRALHQSEWTYKTASDLAGALAAKQVSSVELTEDAIRRIESCDDRVNAMCVRDFTRALDAARAADRALARGERSQLLGIPMTVKESFNVVGTPTTFGNPLHKDFMPQEEALAVERAKAAGAVILGKTNVPFALADWQSYNDIYGVTNNPFDLARTPGGSSGGSAAAVALGYGPLSLGSDMAGSLRVPANFCGVYAHKPTLDIVPSRGHIPPGLPVIPSKNDLGVMGPMARNAADLERLLDVIAGPDELDDAIVYKMTLPPPRHVRLKDYRVLVLSTHPLAATEAAITDAIDDLAKRLEKAGAAVARNSPLLPDLTASAHLFVRLLNSFVASGWPAELYTGIQQYVATLDPENMSFAAERARGAVLTHRDWVTADFRRQYSRTRWRALFASFDAVICPSAPTFAFAHDHVPNFENRVLEINGESRPYTDLLLWPGLATTVGLPATAIPIGRSAKGLPIGVQIIGPRFEDRSTIKLAELIEREYGGFAEPPDFDRQDKTIG